VWIGADASDQAVRVSGVRRAASFDVNASVVDARL